EATVGRDFKPGCTAAQLVPCPVLNHWKGCTCQINRVTQDHGRVAPLHRIDDREGWPVTGLRTVAEREVICACRRDDGCATAGFIPFQCQIILAGRKGYGCDVDFTAMIVP